MMRVLIFTESFGYHTTTFITNLVDEVSKTSDVLILTNEIAGKSEIVHSNLQIKELALKFPALYDFFRMRLEWRDIYLNWYNSNFSKALKKEIEAFKPDVIHCQFGYDAIKFFDNIDLNHIPVLISFQGFDASLKLLLKTYTSKLKKILSKPNVFPIFVCKYLRSNLEKKNIKFNKNIILYSNTDTTLFNRKSYEHSREVIKFVQISSFRAKKGHLFSIKAFKIFCDQNHDIKAELIFTGEGGQTYEAAVSLVKELNLEDKVKFIGWVNPEQAKELLEICHVGISHSITTEDGDQEGIPVALMEAMCMELPVLSTYHSGIPELIEDGVHGYLVEERDVVNYAKRMKDVLKWTYIAQSKTRVREMFSKDRHTSELLNFYQTAIDTTKKI